MSKDILMFGAGGHASILFEIIRSLDMDLRAIICPKKDNTQDLFSGVTLLENDDDVLRYKDNEVVLVNGIGSLPFKNNVRAKVFEKFSEKGYQFQTLIARSAVVSEFCTISNGVQICPNASVNIGANVGANSIINSGAIIEHDCIIGKHNHVAPGVTLSGGVNTGENVHIGTGATVIQGIQIGDNAIIGAGACVTRDVPNNTVVYPPKSVYARIEEK